MNVRMMNGKCPSKEDIAVIEQAIGEPLSANIVRFLEANDGSDIESNVFEIGNNNRTGIEKFIPARDIPEEMKFIENLPEGSYPIAWTDLGNYILINQAAGGTVLFWDHEFPDDIVTLAGSLDSFLDRLEPFDASKVQLRPGQVVISAWINPEFLKRIKDNE